jgi:cytochrome c-type biogenesis protein CcmH/NrfG
VLRTALDLSPRDPEILVMLGKAYESDGSTALAGRNLALAVQASGSGAEESLLFYEFLIRTSRSEAADSVLVSALQANPGNVALLTAAADNSSANFDWPGAEQFISHLQEIDSDGARAATAAAKATLQRRKGSSDELLETIQRIAGSGTIGVSLAANAVGSLIEAGKLDEARAYLADRLAEAPADPDLLRIEAGLTVLQSQLAR